MAEQAATDTEQTLLTHAERQTKALESLLFRADLVLILGLVSALVVLASVLG